MTKKVKKRGCTHLSYILKIEETIRYEDNFDVLKRLKFVHIWKFLRQFRKYKNGRPRFENLKTERFRY